MRRWGEGGGAIFSKIDFFWYNSWVSVDPTLTVSIPDYASCIYSSELFKVRQRRAIFHNKLQNVLRVFSLFCSADILSRRLTSERVLFYKVIELTSIA